MNMFKRRYRIMAAVLMGVIFLMSRHSAAASAETTWTGKASTQWDDAGNWDNGIPAASDGCSVVIPGYTGRQPSVVKASTGGRILVKSGAKLTVENDLEIQGGVVIEEGGEIHIGKNGLLRSMSDADWIIRGTLTMMPGSTAWLEKSTPETASSNPSGRIIVTGSLIAKGSPEEPATIKGSQYPRRMQAMDINGAANIDIDYVTMPNVLALNCSTTPRYCAISHLKIAGVYSVAAWSGARLTVTDSELLSRLNVSSNARVELVHCALPKTAPMLLTGLTGGWVISRDDVNSGGAYVFWPGTKGTSWFAGSVAPGEADNVVIRPNGPADSGSVVVDSDAVCRDLTIEKGARLVVAGGKKLRVLGKMDNQGTVESADDGIVYNR